MLSQCSSSSDQKNWYRGMVRYLAAKHRKSTIQFILLKIGLDKPLVAKVQKFLIRDRIYIYDLSRYEPGCGWPLAMHDYEPEMPRLRKNDSCCKKNFGPRNGYFESRWKGDYDLGRWRGVGYEDAMFPFTCWPICACSSQVMLLFFISKKILRNQERWQSVLVSNFGSDDAHPAAIGCLSFS